MKMMKLFLGSAFIILAVAIAVVPHFNTCEYHGRVITMMSGATTPMKCSWSAQAEIVLGAVLLIVVGGKLERSGQPSAFSGQQEVGSPGPG